ncbi:metalloprotease PmbA [Candidatus Berkiella aquae]|uniref:Metalloprotease PmbA n=1 Tax=Candidatus Berkiella aquae TaxID=295108 RepID=A0A0Q9YVL6_9GAMM|nr:metalloprotease PmbA [Candidatus Berkiella aquae]MCS5710716.1 metalloprotease PmbA [Candidatus Berkiella aquae]
MSQALPVKLPDFVDESHYQQIVTDMLMMAKKLGASSAEVGLHSSIGLNVSVRKAEVETLEFNRDKAIGVTVYCGQAKGAASTTDISRDSLHKTVEAAINLAKLTEADPFAGLANKEDLATEHKPLDLYHPWDITVEEAIALAKECEHAALGYDKRIVNSEGATVSTSQIYHVYGNSDGFLGYYPTSRHSLSCSVIAQDINGMERDYQYTLSRKADELESAQAIGIDAADRALKRLSAQKLSTQRSPVIFHATLASGILGHFINAISGGRLFRKTTFLLDSLEQQVFPDFVHLYERPHLLAGLGSAPFDGDGVKTQDKDIVLNGIVKSYILSAYSSRKLGMQNTGNAGGVHNLFIKPGNDDLTALLKKMDRGLLITELMGQGINLVTGDYSRGVAGFWVENGMIQYPVHELTVASNLKHMFKNLIAVGNDVDKRGSYQSGSLLIDDLMLAGR